MLLRHMLWVPRRVPVCVFERTHDAPRSHPDLVFLGRLNVTPVLFLGAHGYFAYLANQDRLRSAVLSELKRVMTSAGLDSTYRIEDWFLKKDRLVVHVVKKVQDTRAHFDSPSSRIASWLRRLSEKVQ